MFRPRHEAIRIGDRVRSYDLPGLSDQDFISGIVVGTCLLAGIPRFIIQSETQTVHGQEDPCSRTFFAPAHSVVNERDLEDRPILHHVA